MKLLHIATERGLFTALCRNRRWRLHATPFLGEEIRALCPAPAGELLVARAGRGLWQGLGEHWQALPAPADDLALLCRHGDALWAADGQAGLWRRDGDGPWRGLAAPGAGRLLALSPAVDHLLAVDGDGRLFRAARDGDDWRPVALSAAVRRLARCAGQPARLWAHTDRGLYRSDDDGLSWQAVAGPHGPLYGHGLAVHPDDPGTLWCVPDEDATRHLVREQRLAVWRSVNGGQRFTVQDRGLPEETVYDRVDRHGLAIDASGRHLALATTTGGVWLSDDLGGHWQCLSRHLPALRGLCFTG